MNPSPNTALEPTRLDASGLRVSFFVFIFTCPRGSAAMI